MKMTRVKVIPEHESLTVEFKSDLKKLADSEIVDTVVALSNTDGGSLFLGIEDDGTVTGVHERHSDSTQLAAFLANNTVPPVSARVASLTLDANGTPSNAGMSVVEVEVPRSTAIVSSASGKIMRRRLKADGSPESVALYPYEIITRLSTIGQLDYSSFPVPDSTINDFDPVEIQRLRNILMRNKGADQSLLELSDEELFSALRMTTSVNGAPTPTITGILLAGKPAIIHRAVPTHEATFQVLAGTEVRLNQDFDQPLLYTIEKMGDMFEAWNPEREFEDGLFRTPAPEFDRRALREALVNAFGHRDYSAMGRVRVLIDDEGLTISNPGGFVEGINIRNLLTAEPRGRNECLMGALKRVGLAERTGRGIDRIYEGSLAFGRPLPDYSGSTSTTVQVFISRTAPDPLFMKMISEESARTGSPLSLLSLLVLNALKSQRRLSAQELIAQLPFSEAKARSAIGNLIEAGLIEAWGQGNSRAYTLSKSVYARKGKEIEYSRQADIDKLRHEELILQLAKQHGGSITTRDVEQLLRMKHKQAYRKIAKLVKEGKLVLVGSGRAASYRLP